MTKLTRKQFIEKIAPLAVEDMSITNVPASLTIAQGILESADGNSGLTVEANNLFGIKGKGTAGSIDKVTTEYVNGVYKSVVATFRKYNNWAESIADHSTLFINGVSWDRTKYHSVIGKDGITAAREVAKAGYATDPKYAEKLINIINENALLKYDIPAKKTELETEKELIIHLIELVNKLHLRLTDVETKLLEVPAPDWFIKEFPNALDLIHKKTGTADFWRAYALTLRALNQFQDNFTQIGIKSH